MLLRLLFLHGLTSPKSTAGALVPTSWYREEYYREEQVIRKD